MRAALWAAAYGLRLTTAERAKRGSLAFLAGRSQGEVDALGRAFCREELLPRLYPEGVETLRRRHAEGAEVLLVTASPAFYLEALGETLPIAQIIGTRMHVENGVYTGLIAGENCRGVQKPGCAWPSIWRRAGRWWTTPPPGLTVTAGATRPCSACAGTRWPSNPRRRLLRRLKGVDGVTVVHWKESEERRRGHAQHP